MSKTQEIADRFQRYMMPTYAPRIALVRGAGTRVWDADGKVYLDFVSGISVVNLGHCHPRVVDAVRRQAGTLMHASNLYYTEPQTLLAERLSKLSLGGKCFFCNSGAEANECLVKLARRWGHEQGRYEVITMHQSFHGRTLAMVAATGQPKIQKGFDPLPEGFRYATLNDLDSVRAQITDKTVAILVEAVQGEGGVVPAEPEFLRGIRSLCDEKGLLMLCDEVQCGMGRTGHWFGFQIAGIQPDAFSLAKSLGNGCPIGAAVAGPKLADVFHPGEHASTFGGNPISCVAALATLDVMEEERLIERAATVGTRLRQALSAFAGRYEHVKEVRGRGLMLGLVLDQPAKPLVDQMAETGLLTLATAETVVRILPPLTVKEAEVEEAVDIMDECLAAWHGCPRKEEGEEESVGAEPATAKAASGEAGAEGPETGRCAAPGE